MHRFKRYGFAPAIAAALALSPGAHAGVALQQIPGQGAAMYVKLPDGSYLPVNGDANAFLKTLNMNADGSAVDFSAHVPVQPDPLPIGATAVIASSGNVANASAVAAMPAVANKTNYVEGIDCTGSGATLGSVVTVTLAGTISSTTPSWTFTATAGVLLADTPLNIRFNPVPASGQNIALTLTMPALGAGNTNAVCNIRGYVQ